MEVVNPSMTVSRLDLGGSGLCGGWINISLTPLGFLEYLGIYREKRRFGGHPRWAQPTRAFCCVWTPFDIDILRCKKHAKNSN